MLLRLLAAATLALLGGCSTHILGQDAINDISVVGSIASVFGLIVSLYVLARVNAISKSYARQALLPMYLKNLGGSLKNLDARLKKKDREGVHEELSRCRSHLRGALPHLAKSQAVMFTTLEQRVAAAVAQPEDVNFLRESERLRSELVGVLEYLKSQVKESAWRSRDE
jgi:hypothetical protein